MYTELSEVLLPEIFAEIEIKYLLVPCEGDKKDESEE